MKIVATLIKLNIYPFDHSYDICKKEVQNKIHFNQKL